MKNKLWVFLLIFFIATVTLFIFIKSSGNITVPIDDGPVDAKIYFDKDYKSPGCNVILISIDTLRSDHLGCYDYPMNTTPNIDLFARDGVIFTEHIAQAPSTEPSHASIFTSLIPSHHGAFFSMKKPLSQKLVTMAEILKENGYKTISYNGGAQVNAKFGFDQGFDLYESFSNKGNIHKEDFMGKVSSSIDWIRSNPGEKFFLFLHTYEVHHPYTPTEAELALFEKNYTGTLPANISVDLLSKINDEGLKITEQDLQHIINAYDAEIYSMDQAFSVLMDFLEKENLYDNTIIIFTSDHGEEFGEHKRIGWHSHALYDEQIKVPLIIKFKNSRYAGQMVDDQTRSLDILPTLLDLLNIPLRKNFEGVSLVQWFNKSPRKPLFAVSQQDTAGRVHPRTIRTKKYKLYDRKLFDLISDPDEKKNIAWRNKNIRKKMQKELEYFLERDSTAVETNAVGLDKETLNRLKSLGYVN